MRDPKNEQREKLAAELLADLPTLVKIPEAAQALRISVRTLHRVMAERRLQTARVEGRTLITRASLVTYLADALDGSLFWGCGYCRCSHTDDRPIFL